MFHVDRHRVYGHHGHAAGSAHISLDKAEKVIAREEATKAREKKLSAKVLRAGLTVGTTLAFAVLEGYRQEIGADGKITKPGIPGIGFATADLITGVGLHLLSFAGYVKSEKSEMMVDAVANGALASFAAMWGTTLGAELKKKKAGASAPGGFLDEHRAVVDSEAIYASQFR